MVMGTKIGTRLVFKCEKCGWLYNNPGFADKCEIWCTNNRSCNIEITKHAIKVGGTKW